MHKCEIFDKTLPVIDKNGALHFIYRLIKTAWSQWNNISSLSGQEWTPRGVCACKAEWAGVPGTCHSLHFPLPVNSVLPLTRSLPSFACQSRPTHEKLSSQYVGHWLGNFSSLFFGLPLINFPGLSSAFCYLCLITMSDKITFLFLPTSTLPAPGSYLPE